MFDLDYEFIKSKQEQKNILVCLHGYGSNAHDLTPIIRSHFQKLVNTSFIIPNAPTICELHPDGYQWFPLVLKNNHYTINSVKDILKANYIINHFIRDIKKEHNINDSQISLFGFSQGAILTLCNGLYHHEIYGCLISHSGAFYAPVAINLIETFNKNQKVLLIHGKDDDVVPFSHCVLTQKYLEKHNLKYDSFFKNSLGHHVDDETLEQTQNYILKHVY